MNKYVKYFIVGTGLIVVSIVIIFVMVTASVIFNGIQDGTLI